MNLNIIKTVSWLSKKIVFLMACTCLLAHSGIWANQNDAKKKISINVTNAPLENVLDEIKQQTSFAFSYSKELLEGNEKFTLNYDAIEVSELLDKISRQGGLEFLILNNNISIKKVKKSPVQQSKSAKPQERTIRGQVFDSYGVPLLGASIMETGTSNGTSTDFDGNFSITVSSIADSLTISYIGFVTQVVPITSNTMTVTLQEDAGKLDEVVVVGYGTQLKSDISGSVATVELDKAKAIPTTNVAEMIRGQSAGLQVSLDDARPGGNSDILIRGRNSIQGGNDPLIILDGFPIDDINDVVPDDIVSIQILKDASSQAIYGSRASNGVILITTKKGVEGKLALSINSYTTIEKLTRNFDLYSAEEFAQLRREAVRTTNPIEEDGTQPYSDDITNFGGSVDAPEYQNFINGNFVDWEDEVLRSGIINSHTLSLRGGTENTKLYSSVNFFDQKGLIPTSGYKRGSFRLNLDQRISDKASLKANINVSTDKQDRESSRLDFITISPFTGPFDQEGELVREVAGANASSSTINPLWDIRESDFEIKTNLYNLNLVAKYDFSKNFKYRLNNLLSRRFIDSGEYRSRIHSSGQATDGFAEVINRLQEEYLVESQLDYFGQVNDDHKFEMTLLQSINERNISETTSRGTGFGNDILGYDGIGQALNFITEREEEKFNIVSFLGRFRYNAFDKYLLEATARYDGSSVFARNNKWGFFPAASFAWKIHNEAFLAESSVINQLKFRASYGSVGNQALRPFSTLGVVDNNTYIFGDELVTGSLPGTVSIDNRGTFLPNPDLTWETATTLNLALDFGLFNNRLTGTAEYYDTNTTDLLVDISLGGTSGFDTTITNGGESSNSGIELLLSGDLIRTKDVDWNITTIFTRNTNEIVKTGIVDVDGSAKDDIGKRRFVGEPINILFTYVFDGIFQTDEEALASPQGSLGETVTPFQSENTLTAGSIRLKDVNGDGVLNEDDRVVVGQDPDWFGSVSTSFRYKNFSLLADLFIVEGATRFNPYLSSFNQGGVLRSVRNGIRRDYWTPENPSNTAPRPDFSGAPANISVLGVTDASYVRLRTLTLGYQLPSKALDKLGMSNARFYVTGTNLFTITDYKSYSPETNPGDFPDTRALTFGVTLGL